MQSDQRDAANCAAGHPYPMSPVAQPIPKAGQLATDAGWALGFVDGESSDRWLQHAIGTPGSFLRLPQARRRVRRNTSGTCTAASRIRRAWRTGCTGSCMDRRRRAAGDSGGAEYLSDQGVCGSSRTTRGRHSLYRRINKRVCNHPQLATTCHDPGDVAIRWSSGLVRASAGRFSARSAMWAARYASPLNHGFGLKPRGAPITR